jgi:hypothetical protein
MIPATMMDREEGIRVIVPRQKCRIDAGNLFRSVNNLRQACVELRLAKFPPEKGCLIRYLV